MGSASLLCHCHPCPRGHAVEGQWQTPSLAGGTGEAPREQHVEERMRFFPKEGLPAACCRHFRAAESHLEPLQ